MRQLCKPFLGRIAELQAQISSFLMLLKAFGILWLILHVNIVILLGFYRVPRNKEFFTSS